MGHCFYVQTKKCKDGCVFIRLVIILLLHVLFIEIYKEIRSKRKIKFASKQNHKQFKWPVSWFYLNSNE